MSLELVHSAPAPGERPQSRFRRVGALVNPAAGGVRPEAAERMREVLAELQLEDQRVIVAEPDQIEASLKELLAAPLDAVITLGGDGTARLAASLTHPDEGPALIVLPGGTMNMLPHALNGEVDWETALRAALLSGRPRTIVGGVANGEPFFVAVVFGSPARFAWGREAMRAGDPVSAFRRFRYALRRSFGRRLRVRADEGPPLRAEALAVLCPAFDKALEGPPGLEWAAIDPRGGFDLLRLGLHAVFDDWRQDPAVTARRCVSAQVSAASGIPAIVDGEPMDFRSPVRVELRCAAARVITPDRRAE